MGRYNPSAPVILGEEWQGIRDEDLTLSPAVNAVEIGHGFVLAQTRVLQDARFYVHTPPASSFGQVLMAGIYAAGNEALSGPIARAQLSCSAGTLAGSGPALIDAATVADAVAASGDGKSIVWSAPNGGQVTMSFPVNNWPILSGKRILGVNVLYSGSFDDETYYPRLSITDGTDNRDTVIPSPVPLDDTRTSSIATVRRARFGEIANHWLPTTSPLLTNERMPWTYTELLKFVSGAANALTIRFVVPAGGASPMAVVIDYVNLEIIYCEEQRLAVAGRVSNSLTTSMPDRIIRAGTNPMTMRTLGYAALPSLAAGAYTVVVSSADSGDTAPSDSSPKAIDSPYPALNALREIEAISSHPGVQVDIPFPPEDRIGAAFAKQTTHVLPQLTVHVSGGPLPEVHVYGRRAVAPIYGSVTAVQDVNDDVAVGVYGQARFYARRFGNTVVPLTFESVSPAGVSVATSVSDFDLLDEILDGWRRVDIRFAAPLAITPTGGDASFRWTATGENVGNRWEILAVSAPAVSGVPGNLLNQVVTTHRLGPATYAPPAGDTIALTYLAPPASGVAEESYTDAVLFISQDPPPVSGFGVAYTSQTLTGIGYQCGLPPYCIPTGIGYHRLTWSPTSITVSGFGATEIQRYDTVDGVWSTIMRATSPNVTGYNDYEARIGIESRYRIRVCNLYDFCAPWSAELAATLPAPGVLGVSCTNGVLTFTSNASQSGRYNLAHVMQWEDTPVETFGFPEADQVALVEQYQRDFVTALHPTERGGERFQRLLLVNAAAIAPPRLADFTQLRDMAWADLPYVCVRDELGDRWYASVAVPGGQVFNDRQVYLAPVAIVQVTATPAPVDPVDAP